MIINFLSLQNVLQIQNKYKCVCAFICISSLFHIKGCTRQPLLSTFSEASRRASIIFVNELEGRGVGGSVQGQSHGIEPGRVLLLMTLYPALFLQHGPVSWICCFPIVKKKKPLAQNGDTCAKAQVTKLRLNT